MALAFAGLGLPLDAEALAKASDKRDVRVAEIWAVLTVETCGCGFLSDRRPLILFERHIFHRETGGRFDAAAPDVSNPHPGGYGGPGGHQYDRLARAIGLDRRAALRSASWGIGQVMGFNAEIAGWPDVEAMVAAMCGSEAEQLRGLIGEIVHNRLHWALRAHDWATFARGYNGPTYAKNQYDHRLACCYENCGPATRSAGAGSTALSDVPGISNVGRRRLVRAQDALSA